MKYVFVFTFFLPLLSFAQQQIAVQDTIQSFSKGTFNSYVTEIPEAKLKDVDKNWANYLKSLSKGKVQSTNGEYAATLVTYKNISSNPISIYSKLLENNQGVRLTAWLTPDDSVYISKTENADQNVAAEKFIRDFAVTGYQKVVKDHLEDSKTVQHKLESKLASAIKDEEESIKKISENNRAIDRNNDAIKINEKDQATQADLLNNQKAVVEKAKDGGDADALKAEEKRLKDYENDLKKLVKDNEKLKAAIDNWNKHIHDSQRDIEKSKKDQEQLKAQIENQKATVQAVQDKLNSIK